MFRELFCYLCWGRGQYLRDPGSESDLIEDPCATLILKLLWQRASSHSTLSIINRAGASLFCWGKGEEAARLHAASVFAFMSCGVWPHSAVTAILLIRIGARRAEEVLLWTTRPTYRWSSVSGCASVQTFRLISRKIKTTEEDVIRNALCEITGFFGF